MSTLMTDREYAHRHARDYADGTSAWMLKTAYADWYVRTHWTDDGGIDALPGHDKSFPVWYDAEGRQGVEDYYAEADEPS